MIRISCIALSLLLVSPLDLGAQAQPGPAARWEGSIRIPSGDLKVVLDLDQDAKGVWVGDIDIPAQGMKDLALRSVTVSGGSVAFELTADPNGPKFKGVLSADGSALEGSLSQAGSTFPMSLKRAGTAKVLVQTRNAELPAKFIGKWEGSLEAPGATLRLVFNLVNKEGTATGAIDSLDQGATGIPMDEISAAENVIKIVVKIVNGNYSGRLSEDGKTLTGEWSQAGNTLALVLKKAPSSK